MNELIPIKAACIGGEEINAVNARDLYAALGIKKDFSTWVKAQIERAGFIEGVDYIKIAEKSSSPKKGSGIQGRIDYFVTIPAAKEICMMAQTPKGKEVRLYFIECERKLKEVQAIQIPQSLPEALRLAANLAEQKMQLEAQIKEAAPKVGFSDTVQKSFGDMLIREAAKTLGLNPTFLFDWLRARGWINKKNEPYQEYCKRGVIRPRLSPYEHPEKGPIVSVTAHITPKGLYRIYATLLKEGLVKRNDQLELSFK